MKKLTEIEKFAKIYPILKTNPDKFEECLKDLIAKNHSTEKLLKIWRKEQRYSNYLMFDKDENGNQLYADSIFPIYHYESYQYCGNIRLYCEKFSSWNPNKGKRYVVEYAAKEFKAILDSREHIERKQKS